jgi:hypothetical protein
MARIEDFLTKSKIDKIYDLTRKKFTKLPKVEKNSWNAFFLIIWLILHADKKIRPAEWAYFIKLEDAIFNQKWDSMNLIRGRIPSKTQRRRTGKNALDIYDEINNLGQSSAEQLVFRIAKNINKKELQKITILTCARIAISDLEIAQNERFLIKSFSQAWKLNDLLDEIRFESFTLTDSDLLEDEDLGSLVDQQGLRHSQYLQMLTLIKKNGLNVPGDELIIEEFELFRAEQKKKNKITEAYYQKILKDRQKKHNDLRKSLNRKITNTKQSFGPAFICITFLSELNFHKNSFDTLNDNFESNSIWDILKKLNSGELFSEGIIQSKRIRGRKGWMEIAGISTGNNPMGRIYYCSSAANSRRFNVFIDFKSDEKSQKKVFLLLDKWAAAGFK